jgi:hypothetical protein
VAFPLVVLLVSVVVAGIVVAVRQLTPDRPYFFQGMFRYESDLGWPRGVQEDDGERAWVPRTAPAWDPEENELAWAALVGSSMLSELDAGQPSDRVPIVRVKGAVSAAPRHREP